MNDNDKIFGSPEESSLPSSGASSIASSASASTIASAPAVPARQRQQAPSKRARLVDFYNNTRSSYIPTLTHSISNFVTLRDDQHNTSVFPSDAQFFMYDTYSIQNNDDYKINVYGSLYCPGTMTRKNRLLLTLARQLIKSSSNQTADQLQGELSNKLENPDKYNGDDESVYSVESSASSSISINSDNILKDRLKGFMTRSLPNVGIRIVVGSEENIPLEKLTQQDFVTDVNGLFKLELHTKYKPSVVQVSCLDNETTVSFKEVNIISNKPGMSVISDIDDTVKLTGVVNDKRDMFRNVFIRDYRDIEIPGFVNWFTLLKTKDCRIHYVSNSPWQLLKPIKEFFDAIQLPYDSIHLKQYSGNVISALMEPASERKKSTLIKIVSDFPNRKFILIGDTGEKDLEAYLSLLKAFPDQILRIYMRVVPGSLSDFDDAYLFKSILKLIERRRLYCRSKLDSSLLVPDLIDLSSDLPVTTTKKTASMKRKLAPMIPRKPTSLKGVTLLKNDASELELPPKLPTRRTQTFDKRLEHDAGSFKLPSRAATDSTEFSQEQHDEDILDSAQLAANSMFNVSNVMTGLDIEDKRGDMWRERMIRVMNQLPEGVEIEFFQNVDEVIKDSLSLVNSYLT